MRTRAAILGQPGKPWEVTTLELDDPQAGEVLAVTSAAGVRFVPHSSHTASSTTRTRPVWGWPWTRAPCRRRWWGDGAGDYSA